MKNIKHPIQTYEVCGLIAPDDKAQKLEEADSGFSILLDPEKVTDVEEKREILEAALALLENLED